MPYDNLPPMWESESDSGNGDDGIPDHIEAEMNRWKEEFYDYIGMTDAELRALGGEKAMEITLDYITSRSQEDSFMSEIVEAAVGFGWPRDVAIEVFSIVTDMSRNLRIVRMAEEVVEDMDEDLTDPWWLILKQSLMFSEIVMGPEFKRALERESGMFSYYAGAAFGYGGGIEEGWRQASKRIAELEDELAELRGDDEDVD